MAIVIRQLSDENFHDYEFVTTLDKEKPCYCSWWHIKPTSMEAYDEEKKKNPEKFLECVRTKLKTGFHVGVLAYEGQKPVAWIAVGPLPEFYWAWRRTAEIGTEAGKIAAIMCFNTFPDFRDQNRTAEVLNSLVDYGRSLGWKNIEGYPFDASAISKHGDAILWPGLVQEFIDAGYARIGAHWLSSDQAERSIFSQAL
jgi:hypothetical protein